MSEEPGRNIPIAGLGVDIVEVQRIRETLNRTPSFRDRVFTEGERAYCDSKHKPEVHYATHFAAKEAIVKALGTGFAEGIDFADVEVAHDSKGRPVAVLHRRAKEIADEQGILDIHISLSRTHETAIANAIAATEATKPMQPEEKVSPKQQIAGAFKELRGMLDELDAPAASEEDADDDRLHP